MITKARQKGGFEAGSSNVQQTVVCCYPLKGEDIFNRAKLQRWAETCKAGKANIAERIKRNG
jgi:hypothetical protein